MGVHFPGGGKQNGGNGQGAVNAVTGGGGNTSTSSSSTSSSSTSRSKVDPDVLQAAFSSKGFHVPKRTLSKLASQKPDGSSERKLRVSKSVSVAKK